jgi:hypothetical protein
MGESATKFSGKGEIGDSAGTASVFFSEQLGVFTFNRSGDFVHNPTK